MLDPDLKIPESVGGTAIKKIGTGAYSNFKVKDPAATFYVPYKVELLSNDEEDKTTELTTDENGKVALTALPDKDACTTFEGWFTEAAGGAKVVVHRRLPRTLSYTHTGLLAMILRRLQELNLQQTLTATSNTGTTRSAISTISTVQLVSKLKRLTQ
ncbi:hypothetical protein [Mogibacterium diversum]